MTGAGNWQELYPSLATYLESLPEGLDSYPSAQSKSALVRSALRDLDDGRALDPAVGLHEPLRELLLDPPPAGVWVPAVHTIAVSLMVLDARHADARAAEAFTRARVLSVAENPLYRALLRVPGPGRLIALGGRIYRQLQRGTELVTEVGPRRAIVSERFPPHLHPPSVLRLNRVLLQSVVELCHGEGAQARMLEHGSTHATYECSWS